MIWTKQFLFNIQGTLIKPLSPSAIAPDFILMFVVFLALYHPTAVGMVGAFLLGCAGDFASGEFVGPNAAGCVVAFCLSATRTVWRVLVNANNHDSRIIRSTA